MKPNKLVWIVVLLLWVTLINKSPLTGKEGNGNATSSSSSGGGGGGGGGSVTPINGQDSCQLTASANSYSYYKSPLSQLSCFTYAFGNCQSKGMITNGVAYSDDLNCCVWNCKTPPAAKWVCCQAMGLYSCYENSCPPAGIKINEYSSLNTCQLNCAEPAHQWHPGDIVFSGSGSGSITGGTVPAGSSIDLANYGITTDGNCQLGARIGTSWTYATPTCTGLQGMEGLKWEFYDSAGLEYSRIDTLPIGLSVDLHPTQHYLQWDGITDWRSMVSKTLNLPTCNIDYEYTVQIYIYSCD